MIEFFLYGYLAATLLTVGATLSQGVRLLLVVSGALLALLGLGPIEGFVNGRSILGLFAVLNAVCGLMLLLIPAWCILDGKHRPRLSVLDGFLLGFLPGFGADCLQALTSRWPWQLTWLIPGGHDLQGPWAGWGWWCGAITLAWTAAYRFGKDEQKAQLFASLVFGWSVVDRYSAMAPFQPYSAIQGLGLVWATILALIYFMLHERYWLRRSVGYRNLMSAPELQVPGVSEVLKQLGPLGLAHRWRALARRRQVLTERQELIDMGRVAIAEMPQAFKLDVGGADLKTWAIRMVALAALLYVLKSPAGFIFEPLMVGLILLNYVLAPDLEPDDPDPAVRTTVEAILLNSSLACVLLWYFLGGPGFPITCTFIEPQSWEVVLASALCAASWAGSQQRGARAFLRPRHRRLLLAQRCLTVAKCFLVAYLLVQIYPAVQKSFQHPGPWLKILTGLGLGALAALAAHLLNQLSEHVSEKLQQQS